MATLDRTIRRVGLACLILCASCQDSAPEEDSSPDASAAASSPTLVGEWRWVASESGGGVVRPTGAADSTSFEIGPLGLYREHARGAVLSSRYSIAEGRLSQTQDTAFTVLMLDSSYFFPRSANNRPAIAVRSLRGDSLFLSGTGTDSTFYTFVRMKRDP